MSPQSRTRVAILVSGSGSNMAALIEAANAPDYPAQIALVIANVPDAPAIEKAKRAGVEIVVVDHRPFGADRQAVETAMHQALLAHAIDFVAMAGFMRILSPFFVDKWRQRLINIHPSLLPSFTGLHTHRRAIEAGVRIHGCTVHYVDEALDHGPIIGQAALVVRAEENADMLGARVLALEHALYPSCLAKACETWRGGPPRLLEAKASWLMAD